MRQHGLAARYDHGPGEHDEPGKGCRCDRCRAAKFKKQKLRRVAQHNGTHRPMADAEPVRQHVRMLHERYGMDYPSIARAAGVLERLLDGLLYGEPCAGRPPTRTIRPENADALLALTPDSVGADIVRGIGTQRRLRGLSAAGWPLVHIAPRVESHRDHLNWIALAPADVRVSSRIADRVTAVTRDLFPLDPVAHGIEKRVVSWLRGEARRRGWVPLLAWDDIDDPAAKPVGVA